MNACLAFALITLAAQGAAPAGPAPTEGFLEYLGMFEPDDEATIVEFALESEEAADEAERPEQDREEDSDDSA